MLSPSWGVDARVLDVETWVYTQVHWRITFMSWGNFAVREVYPRNVIDVNKYRMMGKVDEFFFAVLPYGGALIR